LTAVRSMLSRQAATVFSTAALCALSCCVADAQQAASPATSAESAPAAPTGLPVLPVLGGRRVLYVIAIGADYSARSKVVATLAEHLDKYRLRDNPWIFAEPAWSVEDYLKQCVAYPQSTEGAIMLSVAATATGSQNNFFYTKNWFALDSDAAFITCDWAGNGKPTYGISWAAGTQVGYASRDTYAQLFSAAALLFAAASTVSNFIPSHTTATATTTVFPKSEPIPPGGEIAEQTNTTSKTSNPSSLANSSAALLAPALAFAPAQAQIPVVDGMTWNAAEDVVASLLRRMNCALSQGSSNAASGSSAHAPFCLTP
ncbi:MAG TPA: hypothetical protein VN936_10375, partial [Candidatus Acidoferrum sp.]|nr:hypothetical protein [Candidatus Acidoferrum sp.]